METALHLLIPMQSISYVYLWSNNMVQTFDGEGRPLAELNGYYQEICDKFADDAAYDFSSTKFLLGEWGGGASKAPIEITYEQFLDAEKLGFLTVVSNG